MANSVAIKRSPIVLIRTFAAIELAVAIIYILGTIPDAYKYELYTLLPFSGSYSYQALKLFLVPFAQFAITVYAFFRWYYESYTIRPGSIIHGWGVLFKYERTVPLHPAMMVTITSSPLGKLLHYGSIRIESDAPHTALVLKNISRPRNLLKPITQAINTQNKTFSNQLDIRELLNEEEGEQLELKSSLRFDHKTGKANRDLEKSTMKTIAAFLNSNGGYLVIGVDNSRKLLGIAYDYPLLQRPSSDGFANHLTQVFNSMIGPEFRHLINVSFHSLDGAEVCVVEALMSLRPVYLKSDGSEHFYIRTGNTTTLLKLSEIEKYNRSRSLRRA